MPPALFDLVALGGLICLALLFFFATTSKWNGE